MIDVTAQVKDRWLSHLKTIV